MEYFVVAPDGQEYGPASVDTLRQWVQENRLSPTTALKNFQTGQTMSASSVPGLFPAPAPTPPPAGPPSAASFGQQYVAPPTGYPRPVASAAAYGSGDIWRAIGYSAAAVIFYYVLGGLGIIFGVYGVISAVRALQRGHKYGIVAVAISVAGLVAVILGYIFFPHRRYY